MSSDVTLSRQEQLGRKSELPTARLKQPKSSQADPRGALRRLRSGLL